MKMMKAMLAICILGITMMFVSSATAGPASKFAAQVSNIQLISNTTAYAWATVLQTAIKTPNKKDLLIGASFETGLYTDTKVKGKSGDRDSSDAKAAVKIRVLVDGFPAYPEEVIYDKRSQTLTAVLGGVIDSCQDLDEDGVIDVETECTVTDEEIQLILDTMAAHHFNFVLSNLEPGEHLVEVQAKIETGGSAGAGSWDALAAVGRGSLTVEEVKATNHPDGIEFLQ